MKDSVVVLLMSCIAFLPASYSQNWKACLDSLVNGNPVGENCIRLIVQLSSEQEMPLKSGEDAYFLFKGNMNSVHLAGDFNNWDFSADSFHMLPGTEDLFYYHKQFQPESRMDYKLVLDKKHWILDPGNPFRMVGGFGPNSELRMPDYKDPWEIEVREGTTKGRILTDTIDSEITGRAYGLQIYQPPGYVESGNAEYPVVYFHDGSDYLTYGHAGTILDNLIDSGLIQPIVAIFVSPAERNEEYAFEKKEAFSSFFIHELMPRMQSVYSISSNAKETAMIGPSFGGHITAYMGYHYPEKIGLCGLHSPSLWPNEKEIVKLLSKGETTDVKWIAVYGFYEPGESEVIGRAFPKRGEADKFKEVVYPDGHSWGLWRRTLDDILIHFFGPD